MSNERHARVGELFLAASNLAEDARERFLIEQCKDDASLRDEVAALLKRDRAPALVDDPLFKLHPTDECTHAEQSNLHLRSGQLPTQIGRYRVDRVLGEGGMGIVYRAHQLSPERPVALKAVHSGKLSSGAIQRFEYEAHVLGRLQHAGVAQIYEAGVAQLNGAPLPFFAMELVDGPDLLTWAREHALDTRQRLLLLKQVCAAVEHAHQKGIIHRDLKPSNILVTSTGQVKVLDFGIARAIEVDSNLATARTEAGQLLGTIGYMSPEQLAGAIDEIDTRSDVYSLGVVAYELLAGEPPLELRGKSLAEAVRLKSELAPPKLGSRQRSFRGDLETIVGKALEKDRKLRYASVSAFATDLDHYLARRPIEARRPSSWYVARRFAQRHAVLATAAATVILALAVGVLLASYGLWRATQERDRAVAAQEGLQAASAHALNEAARARAVNSFLRGILTAPDPRADLGFGAHDLTVAEALDRESARVHAAFAEHPGLEADVRTLIGVTYKSLGRLDQAVEHLKVALELNRERLTAPDPRLARSLRELAGAMHQQGRYDESIKLFNDGLEMLHALPEAPKYDIAVANLRLGWALLSGGKLTEAETRIRLGIDTLNRVNPEVEDVSSLELAEQVASGFNNLGRIYRLNGDLDQAEAAYREAREIYRGLHGGAHVLVAVVENNIGSIIHRRGDFKRAEEAYRGALTTNLAAYGENHPRTAEVLNNLGLAILDQGRPSAALDYLQRALDVYVEVVGENHREYMSTLNNLAFALWDSGAHARAHEAFLRVAHFHDSAPNSPKWRGAMARINAACSGASETERATGERAVLSAWAELKAQLPADDWRLRVAAGRISKLYEQWGNQCKALEFQLLTNARPERQSHVE